MKMAVTVVQWLLVLALLVGHSQGEQTAVYWALLHSNTNRPE